MGITRRAFIKGLGSGATALALSDVILPRRGWAGLVHPVKTKDTQVTTSICPFCGVGCGLIAHTKGGRLINVEGDPEHPINQGQGIYPLPLFALEDSVFPQGLPRLGNRVLGFDPIPGLDDLPLFVQQK